jgi:hypothetical protein
VQVSGHAGDAPWQNLTTFGDKLTKQIGILVVQGLDCDIDATPGHGAVCAAEIRSAFSGFRFHKLLYFAMEGMASEERVIFFLFQAAWSVGAFFISGGDIAGDRFALGSGFGALEDNDVSRHNYSLLSDTGSSSSPSPPSSSVNPNSDVTGCRIRVAFFCFSISVWHSTV